MSKVATISYGSVKEYATVPARLQEFRKKNPRASITTEPRFLDNGSVVIQATIISDLADESSARSTGTAMYTEAEMKQKKSFEKLETIATGRALSLLGYLNNGQVATSEEMLEFEEYQEQKIADAIEAVQKATKRTEFEAIISKLSAEQQRELLPHITKRSQELKNATANK